MKNRVNSDSEKAVSLFPFLAVLLCTMGALLVLLVVLAQRAGERFAAEADPSVVAQTSFEQAPTEDAEERAKLASQLDEVRAYQKKLTKLREQADQRLREEKQKLSHIEEHTRRLEHELARLSIAAEQLSATEKNQVVDQEQAQRELARLQGMIGENKQRVEELREQAQGKKTYAIVPFVGEDGTTAPRIYIECTSEGVIVQPEGLRFSKDDFFDPNWAGNPLVKVVRATQEHIQSEAMASGSSAGALPLPLLLVRPDGLEDFYRARNSLDASGDAYGFDFVGGDHPLAFPISPDPILASVQQQALMNAREQLVQRVRAAPRRFRARLEASAVSASDLAKGPGNSSSSLLSRLGGSGTLDTGDTVGVESNSTGGSSSAGLALGQVQDGQYAASDAEGGSVGGGGASTDEGNQSGSTEGSGDWSIQDGLSGNYNGSDGGSASVAGSSGQPGQNGAASSLASGRQGGSGNQGGASGGSGATGSATSGASGSSSASGSEQGAGTEGQRLGLVQKRSRNAVPIKRPIQVIVRENQIAVMPSRHARDAKTAQGVVVLMDQSTKQIASEFGVALQRHIDEWGIAGRGLYWKPVLNLKVGPEGTNTALRLEKLLQGSDYEVQLPDSIRVSRSGNNHATQ